MLLAHDTFAQYRKAFEARTEIVNLKKQRGHKAKLQTEQDAEIEKRFVAYVQDIERDKLFHFVMAADQPNPVLIIRSPNDNKLQKQFLGYEWSSAKGDEGIKLIKDANGHHLTPLYDETNRGNIDKLNHCIADNFNGTLAGIPETLSGFASAARLADMLDFSRVTFEKQITLKAKSTVSIHSNWPISKLGEIAEIKKGKSITQKDVLPGTIKVVAGGLNFAYLHNQANRPKNTITVSASGASAGYVNFWREEIFASDCSTVRGVNDEQTLYFFHVLQSRQEEIYQLARGAAQPHVYASDLAQLFIPVVNATTQNAIVTECEAVDAEIIAAQARIANALATTGNCVDTIYASKLPKIEIDQLAHAVQYGLSEKMNESGIGYKTFRMNEIVQGRMFDGGAMKRTDISAEEFAKYKLNRGDVLFNRTNSIEHVGKTGLFDLDGDYCFASYLVRIVPDTSKVLPLFLTLMMNSKAFQQEAKSKASKAINQANINATLMRNIKVPVPPFDEQKRLVAEIEKLERTIADAQDIISAAPVRKQAVLQKYL